jgi:hypothetical protein
LFGRDKKCIVTYTTFFLLDQKKEIQALKYQISVILPSHWTPGGEKTGTLLFLMSVAVKCSTQTHSSALSLVNFPAKEVQ